MANHVSGYLSVREISEEGQKVWDEYVVGTLEKYKGVGGREYDVHLGFFLAETVNDDGDIFMANGEQLTMSEMCDEIGAKWAYAQDWDECGISMYSAWSPCVEFCQKIAQKIGEVDETVKLVLTYEDEMPNFVGVATFDKDGTDTDVCVDFEEIREMMCDRDPELAALWNEDEEEWTDEEAASEIMWEVQWDVINEWQSENELWSVV